MFERRGDFFWVLVNRTRAPIPSHNYYHLFYTLPLCCKTHSRSCLNARDSYAPPISLFFSPNTSLLLSQSNSLKKDLFQSRFTLNLQNMFPVSCYIYFLFFCFSNLKFHTYMYSHNPLINLVEKLKLHFLHFHSTFFSDILKIFKFVVYL